MGSPANFWSNAYAVDVRQGQQPLLVPVFGLIDVHDVPDHFQPAPGRFHLPEGTVNVELRDRQRLLSS